MMIEFNETLIAFIVGIAASLIATIIYVVTKKPFTKKEYSIRCDEESTGFDKLSSRFKRVKDKKLFTLHPLYCEIKIHNNGKNDISSSDLSYIDIKSNELQVSPLVIKCNNNDFIFNRVFTNDENGVESDNFIGKVIDANTIEVKWNIFEKKTCFTVLIEVIAPQIVSKKEFGNIENDFFNSLYFSIKGRISVTKNDSLSKKRSLTILRGICMTIALPWVLFLMTVGYKTGLIPLNCTINYKQKNDSVQLANNYQGVLYYDAKNNELVLQNDSNTLLFSVEDFNENVSIIDCSIPEERAVKEHNHYLTIHEQRIIAFCLLATFFLVILFIELYTYHKENQ